MCSSYGRLFVLVVSVLRMSHSKRRNVIQNLIDILKSDLNLIRINFIELSLVFVPIFNFSHSST